MRTYITLFISFLVLFFSFENSANAQYGRHYNHYYDRGYSGRNYNPYRGERVYFHRPAVYLNFGGYRYHYYDGIFYRPYGSYFEVVAPPVGIHVSILPYGYSRLRVGPGLFYYYNGIYYRRYNDYYEVVTPPLGAEVAELPYGAREIVIDNKRYFDYYGTIYEETRNQDGETWYTVTGKNGEVYNDGDRAYEKPGSSTQPNPAQENKTHVGSEVSSLPEGSRTIILNNQKYFVAPDDTYYQELIDNNQVYYKVVVKPTEKN
ncbi:MAG TPA: DUF6515 family protein [Flavisolibacter sp.]|nr:DUF6515 family protein [Flavisolibacter sp.]